MLHLLELKKGLNVLEVGGGTGWNAAVIKSLIGDSGRVVTMEILPKIAQMAHERLRDLGIDVFVVNRDGARGFKENAPYDRIIVTCAPIEIFNSWKKQLKLGGIIVVPVGKIFQYMIKGIMLKRGLKTIKCGTFSFVPLLSDYDLISMIRFFKG